MDEPVISLGQSAALLFCVYLSKKYCWKRNYIKITGNSCQMKRMFFLFVGSYKVWSDVSLILQKVFLKKNQSVHVLLSKFENVI